jgi:hypothetical protein
MSLENQIAVRSTEGEKKIWTEGRKGNKGQLRLLSLPPSPQKSPESRSNELIAG